MEEILPRMENREGRFTNVVRLGPRNNDNAEMAYIELWGNPIAEYEKDLLESQIENGEVIDEKKY